MKLRYVSRHEPYMCYQLGKQVMSGETVEYPAKLAADLLKKFPDKFFEETSEEGKTAHVKNEKDKEMRAAAIAKAKAVEEARKNKMAKPAKNKAVG